MSEDNKTKSPNSENRKPARPAGSRPAGSRPAGSRPAGSRPSGSRPAGSRPAGSRPSGSRPATERAQQSRSGATRPARKYPDDVVERSSSRQSSASRNSRSKKSGFTFKKGLLIYTIALFVIILIVFKVFWSFIKAYEYSQPKYGMDDVVDVFETGDVSELISAESVSAINNTDDLQMFVDMYNSYISGKEIDFEKSPDYTDKNPIFTVKAGEEKVADVKLKSKKMKGHNFKEWEFETLLLDKYASLIYTPIDITVQAPEGAEVFINGSKLGADKKGESLSIEGLDVVSKYVSDIPTIEVFNITGLVKEPEVKVTYNGTDLAVTKSGDTYVASATATDESFAAEMEPYALKVLESYANKFVNLSWDITSYVMPDSELMTTIKTTDTSFYPTKYISSHSFKTLQVSNFVKYGENCFSCEAEYDLYLTFANYYVSDGNETGHFTLFFVKQGDTWYLTDLEYIYDDDEDANSAPAVEETTEATTDET